MRVKTLATLLVVCALSASTSAQVARPRAGGAAPPPVPTDAVSPAEVQRMFDAYALMQAQEQLSIADDQFSAFLTRFKALQDARRRTLMERTRRIMELQRLGNDPQADEGTIRQRLTELKDVETRSAEELRKAYDAIDQILDTRQQAQFRAFEELMERRKLDLISRARQSARPNARPNGQNARPNARPRQPM